MSALQIPEFHQLMPHKSRIAVGDDQMAFPFLDLKSGREVGGPGSSRVDDDFCRDLCIVGQPNLPHANLCDRNIKAKLCSPLLCTLHQKTGRTRWIQNTIFGNEKTPGHAWSKVGVHGLQTLRIEYFRGNSTL